MGSHYFGETNIGSERSGSSSSRKGRKPNKQPQRGLGVAQLEKIRLRSEMCCGYIPSQFNQEDMRVQTAYSVLPSSPSSYGLHGHQNFMMGFCDSANISYYHDSQPTATARYWNTENGMLESNHFVQPSISHFWNQQVQDSWPRKGKKERGGSNGSSTQNSSTSDNQELDLELRL